MIDYHSSTRREEISMKIRNLRNQGNIAEAIAFCKEAQFEFESDNFYPMILGDLYTQSGDYDSASKAYIDFLKKIPPNKTKLFGDFANRYYRLQRVCSEKIFSAFASSIFSLLENTQLEKSIAFRCRDLIKNDILEEMHEDLLQDEESQNFSRYINDNSKFDLFVSFTKKIELKNPAKLEYLLDHYILNREKSTNMIRFDQYCVSIYERVEKYDKAIKLARELLSIHFDAILVRTVFRICRKLENYEYANQLINDFSIILKSNDFNILYELVYFYEANDDLDNAISTLARMERFFKDNAPIQKTIKNFYLRFGQTDDVKRVNDYILELKATGEKTKKKFLNEVKESEAEVGSKIKELYSEVEHHKRLAAISDLTTGISHELGQPITNIRYTIQFYSKFLEKNIDRETLKTVFGSILKETERMGGLIKRLSPLTSSRSVIEGFNVMERINMNVKSYESRLKKSKIVVYITPKKPISIFTDPVKFDQLIINLLLNSIDSLCQKNTEEARKIQIKVNEIENNINIRFSDSGIGIPIKYRGKIFDPFFTTKSPGKGEGLGLFIIWNLLKMQGGKIRLDSDYRDGARFLISIPRTAQIEEENTK